MIMLPTMIPKLVTGLEQEPEEIKELSCNANEFITEQYYTKRELEIMSEEMHLAECAGMPEDNIVLLIGRKKEK